jgi:hypothetical protein
MQTFLNVLAWFLFGLAAGIAYGINSGLLGADSAAIGLIAVAGAFSALEYTKDPRKESLRSYVNKITKE